MSRVVYIVTGPLLRSCLLVDRELTERENRRLQTRLRKAKLRHDASIEDLDWRAARGLDRSLVMKLAMCRWIERHHNVVITGATGVGNPRWPAPGSQSLLGRLQRALSASAAPVGRGAPEPGRRTLRQAAAFAGVERFHRSAHISANLSNSRGLYFIVKARLRRVSTVSRSGRFSGNPF